MSRQAFFLLVLFLATALSCGGCKDEENNNGGGLVPDGEFGEVLMSMCATLDRCPDAFGYAIAYRSQKECAAILNFSLTCRLTETELGDDMSVYGVKRVEPTIDSSSVDACKAWLADTSCDQLALNETSPCQTVFSLDFDDDDDSSPSGTVALDEDCEVDEDCQADLFCSGGGSDPDRGISYCRICRPRADEGEDCAAGALCREGLYCKGAESGPFLCSAPEPAGFRCSSDTQCASEWCNTTLEELGGWGQCDSGGQTGDPCEQQELERPCRQGFFCEDGSCADRRPNGGACADHDACLLGNCNVESGICGTPDGEPCSYDEQCATSVCTNETCGFQNGECYLDADCAGGEVCSGACQPPNCECDGCPVGQCMPSGQAGECVDDFDCDFGDCVNGACEGAPELGDSCNENYECYPAGQCSNNVCVAKAGPGDACVALDSCAEPFLCIEGTCQLMNLACEPARAGQRCAWLRVCDDSSYCDLLDGVTCKARARAGEVCQNSPIRGVETCQNGSTCQYDEASGESICVVLPTLGQTCEGQCADSYCWNGTCQADPVGRPCQSWEENPCPDGLRCHDDREVCLPKGGLDEDCRNPGDCEVGLYCDNRCQPRLGAGESCNDSEECLENLYCTRESWTCVPDLTSGAACETYEDSCAQDFFCDSSSNTCVVAQPPGADCSENNECLSGVCYSRDFCAVSAECELP